MIDYAYLVAPAGPESAGSSLLQLGTYRSYTSHGDACTDRNLVERDRILLFDPYKSRKFAVSFVISFLCSIIRKGVSQVYW